MYALLWLSICKTKKAATLFQVAALPVVESIMKERLLGVHAQILKNLSNKWSIGISLTSCQGKILECLLRPCLSI